MAFAPAGSSTVGDRLARRIAVGQDGTGPLDRLLRRPSTLDRLVADAGPLGRFMIAREDALPAGTSAYTKRAVDTLNGVEAKLGLPRERVLANLAPPILPPPGAAQAGVELPPGRSVAPEGAAALDPRPAVSTDAGNRLAGGASGNSATIRA